MWRHTFRGLKFFADLFIFMNMKADVITNNPTNMSCKECHAQLKEKRKIMKAEEKYNEKWAQKVLKSDNHCKIVDSALITFKLKTS